MTGYICLLIAGALISEYPDDTVVIHEWGVILLDDSYLAARGCPDGYIDEDGLFQEYPMAEVTAPVVYFYGEECYGDFTVTVGNGPFTLLDPPPDTLVILDDAGTLQQAIWRDVTLRSSPADAAETTEATLVTRSPMLSDCFSWAVPFWRAAPANTVHHPGSGYSDRFIYYESGLDDPGMFLGDHYGYSGDALLFFAEDGEMVCVRTTFPGESDAAGETLSDLEIMTLIRSWSHDGMLPEEIWGLWQTWKPLLRSRCESMNMTMMLFPLDDGQEAEISHLSFVPVENLQVEYERLLLGLGPV